MLNITCRLDDTKWATSNYDVVLIGYDDVPQYEWSDIFTLEGLGSALGRFNDREHDVFKENHYIGGANHYNDLIEEFAGPESFS